MAGLGGGAAEASEFHRSGIRRDRSPFVGPDGTGLPDGEPIINLRLLLERPSDASSLAFGPGAHTHWHTQSLAQTLILTAGVGRVQRWGGAIEENRPSDVVRIPPGVKHGHGAAQNSTMTHLAVQEALDGKAVDWLEPVGDDQYRVAPTVATAAQSNAPSPAHKLMADVAQKLVQSPPTMSCSGLKY